MRLLILSESPLEKIGPDYYALDPWVRIPRQWADHCERVTLWSPVAVRGVDAKPRAGAWRVDVGPLRIEHHDYYYRFVQYYRLLPRRMVAWTRRANSLIQQHDIVVVRAPSPMGPLLMRSARRQGRHVVLMLLLNLATQSDRILAARGLKKALYWTVIRGMLWQERRAVKQARLVYVYSKELAQRHGSNRRIRLIQDPHLRADDIRMREDTCQSDEVRLLRVCWLIPSKGVEYLLRAVALLRARGFRVRLEIVGQERSPGYQTFLESLAAELGIRDRVGFPGWVPFDRISEVYWRNDIQVISSLGEGTPRCIVEGFARGLPLVSTSVGGCRDVLVHEKDTLLVPPRDPEAIANAVERLIVDGKLRRCMIRKGYEMARSVTFESLGMTLLQDFEQILDGRQ